MKSLASEDKVAQELPSYLSGAVTRGQPGEKAVTGRREYVDTTNDTTLVKQDQKGGSSPRPGPSLFLMIQK